jgi:hypothetical protein
MSLYANGLQAQHHISEKTTFRILCAGAHKMREIRTYGLMRGGSQTVIGPWTSQSVASRLLYTITPGRSQEAFRHFLLPSWPWPEND